MREFVGHHKLCFNCLGSHQARNCRSTRRCRQCGGTHHTLLHQSSTGTNARAIVTAQPNAEPPNPHPTLPLQAHAHHAAPLTINFSRALLATARVRILDTHGRPIEARALLDQGSELSFIRESLVQSLGLKRQNGRLHITGLGDEPSGTTRGFVSLSVQSRLNPKFTVSVDAYILSKLTGQLPSRTIPSETMRDFQRLPLADPTFGSPDTIDIVLGADIYGRLLIGAPLQDKASQLTAQETALGWIITGPLNHMKRANDIEPVPARVFTTSVDHDLQQLLQRFWQQEHVEASTASTVTPAEQAAETHFQQTHFRDQEGRYTVRLSLRKPVISLGRSRHLAEEALRRMQGRFTRNPELEQLYSNFLVEYEELGHMEPAPPAGSTDDQVFYLPHHGVLRRHNTTCPLRVVFNGSAQTTSGLSLNDCLHVGPKLQLELSDVLLRWRTYRISFSADVSKMYRQIGVHPADQNLQRILWSSHGQPREFRLTTVTYGLSCAPFLALRVMRQLAEDEGSRFPEAPQVVHKEMYVDDILSGADSVAEAQRKIQQLNGFFTAGGFRLHKWTVNDPAALAGLADAAAAPLTPHEFNTEALPRALGLEWHPTRDVFVFHPRLPSLSKPLTKRIALSRVAQIFDPLGLLAPAVILAKILLQKMWKLQLDWDDPLPPTLTQHWSKFEQDFDAVRAISIERWLGTQPGSSLEFHGFSDASQNALGMALYLRVVAPDLSVRVILLSGKSRVAPLKPTTIPRLELSAALMLTRLLARVRAVLPYDAVPVHLWTDSSVTLFWIQGPAARWQEFVANRVAAIHELVPDAKWHHVRGTENPADLASRGTPFSSLAGNELWWRGPDWLADNHSDRSSDSHPIDPGIDLEIKSRTNLGTVRHPGPVWELLFRYSCLTRLLRITAWVIRAASAFKGRSSDPRSSPLTSSEIANAERFWALATQRSHFERELSILASGAPLPRQHCLQRLAPFVDAHGLIRVGGRLRHSNLEYDSRNPIVLPRDAFFSSLIIDNVHHRTMHGGAQLVLAIVRRTYWIIGGRAPIASFIRRCVRCARFRASTASQLMGQLPPTRVLPARPFLNSGVDYAGPFTIRAWRGRAARSYKGYLVLFVCLATSAVHLELASDYSTAGFLAAYKRFTGRRGICATLLSDCGTNFVGADAELRRLFSAASRESAHLANTLASDGTQWRFNPPGAPHFGGKWESAVKSTKFHLRRVVGEHILTFEEFSTVLVQIEAILNSRPLTQISDDPTDLEALTPAHFLTGGPLAIIPEPPLDATPVNRLTRWQLLRHMLDSFWTRWSREYLQRFQARTKWRDPQDSVTPGKLALLLDERNPPAKWPMCRILKTHAGADGLVRVVTVRTATSELKRPITKLCLLPIAD